MATLVLNAYSSAYPDITNRIRASIFLQSDPLAIIASIIDTTVGHPIRIWSFPGLPRANYGFTLDEINGAGDAINNLAYFDVVPGEVDGELVRDDEQIRVGTTPGLVAGANTATFDGTAGKPDYRGWDIVIDEMTGRDILATDFDYSWNKVNGVFTLLGVGDIFNNDQFYNIHFNSILNPQGNSVPTIFDFGINLITTTQTIDADFFGKILIVEPADVYIEVTLPPINTIPQGRKLIVQMGTNVSSLCAKFLSQDAEIVFLRGSVYAYSNEAFSIYRFNRDGEVDEWRVCECDGNFKTVGELVGDDSIQSNVYNKKLLDGSVESTLRYARIYNEIVLNLPLTQRVSFADWATGNNKYFYSLDNGSDQFHFPDRRGIFERNNNTGKAGDFATDTFKEHNHYNGMADDVEDLFVYGGSPDEMPGSATHSIQSETNPRVLQGLTSSDGDSETAPKHYLINKYVLI